MNQIKNYTTREQIGKIINILPSESADMYYAYGKDKPELLPYSDYCLKMMCLPCWSVGALLNFIPVEIEYCNTIYKIDIRKSKLTEEISIYQIAYGNYKFHDDGSSSWKDMINTGQHENLINACIDIILWLKENKIISTR